ncbi:MAG: hypothetical protein AAGG69_06615, partial [Pseudomonadota bacterium]
MQTFGMKRIPFICITLVLSSAVSAGEVDVTGVQATQAADGTWRFEVTVKHADEGWDHYADRWDVVGPDG